MIKSIIEFLDGTLNNWPVVLLGLAEMRIKSVKETETVSPLYYKGKGNWDAVNILPNTGGWIYHRADGFADEDQTDRDRPDNPKTIRTYPFITAALVKKSVLDDTVYSSSELAEKLANQIYTMPFNADNVRTRIIVNDTIYDPIQVAALEFQGIDYFIPADMVLIRVNWTARFTGDVACFATVELC